MATVDEIQEQIRKQQSRIAILDSLQMYVQTHYLSSSAAAAELQFLREDRGVVSDDDIHDTIGLFATLMSEAGDKVQELKSLRIEVPKVAVETADQKAKPAKKGKKDEQAEGVG